MENFFGIPIDSLTVTLLVIFVLSLVVLSMSALRNRVIFKMAARNLPRRRANTVLTVLGLMLAAMIFSASFSTGDTLTHSIRTIAVNDVGEVDIMVVREGIEPGVFHIEDVMETSYFDSENFERVRQALKNEPKVEGTAPAIIEVVPVVAIQSELNEPIVDLLGLDYEYSEPFDPLIDRHGNELSLEDLNEGEVYINTELAESLEVDVSSNDKVYTFLGEQATQFTVKDIYKTGGTPSGDLSMVTSLSSLQALRGSEDINYILITNQGGSIGGARHTDAIMEILEADETGLQAAGLKAEPVKQDVLDIADEAGSGFTTVFLVFGSFSIIAGTLLIFLIFVMLAAERKRELGIARAVGTQRAHVIRLFTFEGVLYALIASAIGSALGIVFGRGMIEVMDIAFEEMGFDLVYHFTSNSLIISYTLGVILTLVVVAFSAWRVGRLNIVRAIRDIPEPPQEGKGGIRGLIISILLPLLGLIMLSSGLGAKQLAPYTLGASLTIIGLCLLARRFRLPDRAAYTLAGAGLLIFWLMPFDWHPYNDEMKSGMEMFTLSGIFMVAGAVWVVMYNSDLLLAAITSLFGRIKALAPVLKTAVSYPMASRFRTGMALAMFSLIVFTLVVMAIINASFDRVLQDTDRVSGGFHIRSTVSYINPIPNIEAALDEPGGVGMDNFQSIASINRAPVKIREVGTDQEWEDIYLTGVDAHYTSSITYVFELMTADYTSKADIWKALTDNPSFAVVSTTLVPTREGGPVVDDRPDFQITEGDFYLEDEVLPDDIFIEVQNYNPDPDKVVTKKLQVIGVVDIMAGPYAAGPFIGPIITSEDIINALAGRIVPPTSYLFQVKPEKVENVPDLATNLEKQFQEHGMDTTVMAEEIKDYTELNGMFFDLMMVFMGLGLIVGIAALGVIAARSVVERRQQIGVLRALGFQRRMVQFSFLLESSFIALLGIGLGIALGLVLSIQIIPDIDIEGLELVIPWARIILIVALAYGASLLTTFLPARQASRVYPAEALRFE